MAEDESQNPFSPFALHVAPTQKLGLEKSRRNCNRIASKNSWETFAGVAPLPLPHANATQYGLAEGGGEHMWERQRKKGAKEKRGGPCL